MHPIRLVPHVVKHTGSAEESVLDCVTVVGNKGMGTRVSTGHKNGLEEEKRRRVVRCAVAGEEFWF
jgi:hypothetical protein